MGVWTGKLPEYLRMVVENDSNGEGISTTSENIDAEIKTSAQDIASYQVLHIFKRTLPYYFSGVFSTEMDINISLINLKSLQVHCFTGLKLDYYQDFCKISSNGSFLERLLFCSVFLYCSLLFVLLFVFDCANHIGGVVIRREASWIPTHKSRGC